MSTTPWAFPCCSQSVLPEVNRKLLHSWSFYSLYSALCEIKINRESNFSIRTSPGLEFLLTPQTHSCSHCPQGEELAALVPWGWMAGYWCVGSTPGGAGKPFSCPQCPWGREIFGLSPAHPTSRCPRAALPGALLLQGFPPAQCCAQKLCPEPHI